MEAAVVGGTGFIGQYAVRALREHKCTVSVLDSKTSEIDQANVLSTASHILWLAQPTRDLIKRLVHDTPELQKLVIARLANVYGDVKNRGIIGRAFSSLNDGTVLTVSGDGMQVRDYIHV